MDRLVAVPVDDVTLGGDLGLPPGARGLVVLTDGRGSGRASPMNRYVARILRSAGFATLLFDLLTTEEEAEPRGAGRPDVRLLATRLIRATDWLGGRPDTRLLPLGYFAVDTAAAAALVAAAARPHLVRAVVACGKGRDLEAVRAVRAATLLIVAGADAHSFDASRAAIDARSVLEIVREPAFRADGGAPDRVAALARRWFEDHLSAAGVRRAG